MAKNVIIMGATSGIGLALAERLASLGCSIAIAGRREDLLREAAARLSELGASRVITETVDVRDAKAPLQIAHLSDTLGGVDLYIHAAGIGKENTDLSPQTEEDTSETNVTGFVRCVDAAAALLRSGNRGGQIAVISSAAATRGLGASPAYSASKAFQAHYLEALRQMFSAKDLDITVTDIRPGFVDTALIAGKNYPLTMPLNYAADRILRAILAKKRVAWIDWKYQVLCLLWSLLPGIVWESIPLGFVPFSEPLKRRHTAEDGKKDSEETGRTADSGTDADDSAKAKEE